MTALLPTARPGSTPRRPLTRGPLLRRRRAPRPAGLPAGLDVALVAALITRSSRVATGHVDPEREGNPGAGPGRAVAPGDPAGATALPAP